MIEDRYFETSMLMFNDLKASLIKRDEWEKCITENIKSAIINHDIINKFKYFTIYPSCLMFFVNGSYLRCEAAACKTETMDKFIKNNIFYNEFNNHKLYKIFEKDDVCYISYAYSENELIA